MMLAPASVRTTNKRHGEVLRVTQLIGDDMIVEI